jgi:hypothetical integral membrane protein (TIGR02206 family)
VQIRALGIGIGVFMIVEEFYDRGYHYFVVGDRLAEVLPLHLCGASVFLVAFTLIFPRYAVYEVVYFWGLGGAAMAILTPDIQFAFPHLLYITYFVSHALIVIGVLYVTVHYHFRPTLRSFWKTLIISNVYMAVVYPLDYLLDANYLFLREKPAGLNLLDFMGPWPWYIVGMEVVGIPIFFLLYVPYLVRDFGRKRAESTAEPG